MSDQSPRGREYLRHAPHYFVLAAIVVAALAGLRDVPLGAGWLADDSTADWPAYGRDPGGSRFSPLAQIDRRNVKHLEVAWVYRTGDAWDGSGGRPKTSFQCTPLVVDGVLYVTTAYCRIVALDPLTGEEHWAFDPQLDRTVGRAEIGNRGVATWVDPQHAPGDPRYRRIFVGTLDARLIAVDAVDGKRIAEFGGGEIDLSEAVALGDHQVRRRAYGVTSPPAVLGDVVVVGSAIGDNSAVTLERGVVRAFDVRTGEKRWEFDPIPRDPADPAYETWENDSALVTGAANVWAQMSVDVERNLVFLPTSSASPDYYGGERQGSNRYANSVVALDGSTGQVRWDYQLVHHDLWDYDIPAQPSLVTVRRDGREIPAVAQATKMGFLFLLDRETGEPLFPVEERPVPASDVPGETSWPTQPFPTAPGPLAPTELSADDGWGITPWDRTEARELIAKYRFEGIYTPPSQQGSVHYPCNAGGTNWGGVAFEPRRGLVVVNMTHVPFVMELIPRERFESEDFQRIPGTEYGPQRGTPYVMGRRPLLTSLGLPCSPPPWGTLVAVEVETGQVKWDVPLGTVRDLAPVPLPIRLGVPNLGGPMVTGGGLVFIGAAMDNYLRAFDIETGVELWKRRLPAGGQATPMTYRLADDQPQYVVIAAGGHGKLGTTIGDYLVAFKLRSPATIFGLWLLEAILAVAVVLAARRYVWPEQVTGEQPLSRFAKWRRRAGRFLAVILLLGALGLVLPGVLTLQQWLTPFSCLLLVSLLLFAALAKLAARKLAPAVALGALGAVACGIAYWEIGELFWVGVLPF